MIITKPEVIPDKTRKADNRKVTTGAEIIRCWQGMYLIK